MEIIHDNTDQANIDPDVTTHENGETIAGPGIRECTVNNQLPVLVPMTIPTLDSETGTNIKCAGKTPVSDFVLSSARSLQWEQEN